LALKDRKAALFFTAPAALIAAGAAQAQFWPDAHLTSFILLSLATAIVLPAGRAPISGVKTKAR
jgi:hypothetical protein